MRDAFKQVTFSMPFGPLKYEYDIQGEVNSLSSKLQAYFERKEELLGVPYAESNASLIADVFESFLLHLADEGLNVDDARLRNALIATVETIADEM